MKRDVVLVSPARLFMALQVSLVEPSFGLASMDWRTFPGRHPCGGIAAIALGDKIKSPQPSFGDRPSPSKKKWDSCRAERRSKRGTFFWPACMARTTEEG